DRGAADGDLFALQLVDQLVGVEMAVPAEDVVDHIALLSGVALRTGSARQVFAELVFGALRDLDSWQLHAFLLKRRTAAVKDVEYVRFIIRRAVRAPKPSILEMFQ